MTRYTKDHEWVRLDGDVATIGISTYAVEQLGDVVYVETPAPGAAIAAGKTLGVVESSKAASDVYAPVSGEVVAVHEALNDADDDKRAAALRLVKDDPEGAGWFLKVKLANGGELDALMDEAAYADYVKGL